MAPKRNLQNRSRSRGQDQQAGQPRLIPFATNPWTQSNHIRARQGLAPVNIFRNNDMTQRPIRPVDQLRSSLGGQISRFNHAWFYASSQHVPIPALQREDIWERRTHFGQLLQGYSRSWGVDPIFAGQNDIRMSDLIDEASVNETGHAMQLFGMQPPLQNQSLHDAMHANMSSFEEPRQFRISLRYSGGNMTRQDYREVRAHQLNADPILTGRDPYIQRDDFQLSDQVAEAIRRNAQEETKFKERDLNNDRFFNVNVTVNPKDTFITIYFKILSELQVDQIHRDPDDYELDPEKLDILDIRDVHQVRIDKEQKIATSHNRLKGFHRFSIGKCRRYEDTYAIHQLRMHDFSCIFESLMIIKAHYEHYEPDRVGLTWAAWVMQQFAEVSPELRQLCLEGKVMKASQLFSEETGIRTDVFNLHDYQEYWNIAVEYNRRLATDQEPVYLNYFLLYWHDHIFPITFNQLELLVQQTTEEDKKYLQHKTGLKQPIQMRVFNYKPPVIDLLMLEIVRVIIMRQGVVELPVHITELEIPLCQIIKWAKTPRACKAHLADYYTILKSCVVLDMSDDVVINEVLLQITPPLYYTDKPLEGLQQLDNGIAELYGKHGITKWWNDEHILDLQNKRGELYDTKGICGIDIETCIDNSLTVNASNFRVYCICIKGRLQRILKCIDQQGRITYNKELVEVKEAFWGFDCKVKFVDWLIDNGHTEADMDFKRDYAGSSRVGDTKHQARPPKLENYFFAHNGMGFDYRFLYEELYARVGDMLRVGDIQHTKEFHGQGIFFYDTALVLPGSLAKVAKSMFPNDESRHKSKDEIVKGLTLVQFKQLDLFDEERIIDYCFQDTYVVQQIAYTFFRELYLQQIGFGFVTQLFYYSAASLAWNVWSRLFLTHEIQINPKTQAPERFSYRGGGCNVFKTQMKAGMAIDANSQYPAAMCNEMPWDYVDPINPFETLTNEDGQPTEVLDPLYFTATDLYLASFRFPENIRYPSIALRFAESLVNVQRTTGVLNKDQQFWLWGVELTQACNLGATIYPYTVIRYIPVRSHMRFVKFFYGARQKAKREGNATLDLLYKLIMNSEYGKHGQKYYSYCMIGGQHFAEYQLLKLQRSARVENIVLTVVPTEQFDMFQIKFDCESDYLNHKGTTVRIASYITACARVGIYNAIAVAVEVFGENSVAYTDTDSIMIETYQKDSRLGRYYDFQTQEDLKDPEVIAVLKDLITDDINYKIFASTQVQDPKNLSIVGKLALLMDEDLLGAFKREKIILWGAFLGPKQYLLLYGMLTDNNYLQAVKLKGVNDNSRTPEQLYDMAISLKKAVRDFDDWGYAEGQVRGREYWEMIFKGTMKIFDLSGIFTNGISGVNYGPMMKVICPTLFKRKYDIANDTSMPFNTLDDFFNERDFARAVQSKCKQALMRQEVQKVVDYQMNEAVIARKISNKLGRQQQNKITEFKADMRDLLSEKRMKHMLTLPKIKFEQIQDTLYKILDEYTDYGAYANTLYRMHRKAYHGIYDTIRSKKKGMDNKSKAQKKFDVFKLEKNVCARVIAYSLFLQEVLRMEKEKIPHELQLICAQMARVCYGKSLYKERWRDAINKGMIFLQAPIQIVTADMSATVTIVTLWDRLEDYMKRLELNPWTILKFTEDANTMTARENYVQTKMIPLDDYDKFMMQRTFGSADTLTTAPTTYIPLGQNYEDEEMKEQILSEDIPILTTSVQQEQYTIYRIQDKLDVGLKRILEEKQTILAGNTDSIKSWEETLMIYNAVRTLLFLHFGGHEAVKLLQERQALQKGYKGMPKLVMTLRQIFTDNTMFQTKEEYIEKGLGKCKIDVRQTFCKKVLLHIQKYLCPDTHIDHQTFVHGLMQDVSGNYKNYLTVIYNEDIIEGAEVREVSYKLTQEVLRHWQQEKLLDTQIDSIITSAILTPQEKMDTDYNTFVHTLFQPMKLYQRQRRQGQWPQYTINDLPDIVMGRQYNMQHDTLSNQYEYNEEVKMDLENVYQAVQRQDYSFEEVDQQRQMQLLGEQTVQEESLSLSEIFGQQDKDWNIRYGNAIKYYGELEAEEDADNDEDSVDSQNTINQFMMQ